MSNAARWLIGGLLFMALSLSGCGQEGSEDDGDGRDDSEEQAAPPASFGGGQMAAAGMLGSLLEQAKEPGPFDPPKKSKDADPSKPHHVVMTLGGGVTELDAPFSLFGGPGGAPLRTITGRLYELAADDKVQSILLRIDELGLSSAVAEELRAAVASIDKPIHCHTEMASDLTVSVLAACDSVTLAPTGTLALEGPSAMPMYMKKLLDKIGVKADFLHIGAYKGAAEPLTRTEPSPEMKETLDAILDGAYARLVASLARGRKVDEAKARAWVDKALFTDEEARKAGLVDAISSFEDWRAEKVGGGEWIAVKLEEEKDDLGGFLELLGGARKKKITEPHLALLYAVGNVVDGAGSGGPLGARSEIAPRRLVAALRAAADDDNVKAIVLRVDSPGGSALASELIWHAVRYAKEKKPVVVSMGSVAGSGGYYISCGATEIWAQPDTLTGSIGVVGGKIVLKEAADNLGITIHEMGRGKRSTLMSPLRAWTPEERRTVESYMQDIYRVFKERVAEGRGLSVEAVEAIARGRVWIGADAKERKLVDRLGGLDDAIASARKAGGLAEDSPVNVYPGEPTLFDLLESFGGAKAPSLSADLALLLGDEAAGVVLDTLEALLSFRKSPVQVVLFFPVVR